LQQVDDTEGIEVSKREYNLATFVGRLEPLHNGHIPNIQKALEIADHVLVIVGSANQPRTPKNPFTADERIAMIKSIFPDDRVQAVGVEDFYPDALWLQSVQTAVHKHLINNGVDTQSATVAILGHDKDHTSFYLSQFPTWKFIEIGHRIRDKGEKILDASVIRDHYFAGEFDEIIPDVPTEVLAFLDKFSKTPEYKLLVEEQEYITRYKKEWDAAPYAPTFVTTDAVVVQSGHVLLVKRRTAPGKGLWALPGGFINENERLDECVIRELREETKVKVPAAVLEGSIRHKHTTVFDAPNRSLRGRTITNAFLIDLKPQPKLPKVKGADDAEEADWFPLNVVDAMGSILFEDHKLIIQTMVAKLED
jgi:bifunctional NMN adenylyltransferase/nudix hydrolase